MSINPKLPPELRRRPWYRYVQWSDELMARLEATPGVERAAITTQVPAVADPSRRRSRRAAARRRSTRRGGRACSTTSAIGYFQLMGIRLLERPDVWSRGSPQRGPDISANSLRICGVAVVSESTARVLWPRPSGGGPGAVAAGRRQGRWREVVGVVEDIQFSTVGESPGASRVRSVDAVPTARPRLLVKTSGNPAAAAPIVRAVAQQMSIGSNIDQVATLDALVSRATAQPRFTSRVVATFGTLALLLAGGRHLRHVVVHGEQRAARDRDPHGPGRLTRAGDATWCGAGPAPAVAGALSAERRSSVGAHISHAAVQRDLARSGLARRCGRSAAAGRNRSRARIRGCGRAHRSGRVAARGVGRQSQA